MQQKTYMQDQVGTNKIKEIVHHYSQYSLKMWVMRIMVIGLFLLIGVYW
jgi:hypothetical protein